MKEKEAKEIVENVDHVDSINIVEYTNYLKIDEKKDSVAHNDVTSTIIEKYLDVLNKYQSKVINLNDFLDQYISEYKSFTIPCNTIDTDCFNQSPSANLNDSYFNSQSQNSCCNWSQKSYSGNIEESKSTTKDKYTDRRSLNEKLLNGGLNTGDLLQIRGHSGTGKTQLCMSLALSCVSFNSNSSVLYVDIDGSFSIERLHEMYAYRYVHLNKENFINESIEESVSQVMTQTMTQIEDENKLNMKSTMNTFTEVLSQLMVSRVYTFWQLNHLLEQIFNEDTLYQKDNTEVPIYSNLRMIVIDSISAFSSEINYKRKRELLSNFLSKTRKIAKKYNICVVITNVCDSNFQIVDTFDEEEPFLCSAQKKLIRNYSKEKQFDTIIHLDKQYINESKNNQYEQYFGILIKSSWKQKPGVFSSFVIDETGVI